MNHYQVDLSHIKSFFNGSKMKDAPKNEIVVRAARLNVDYTFRVKVDTEIGTLNLNPIKNHEDLLRSIKLLNISGITAIADISINKKFNTFSDLLSKSIEIIEGFLCISRLADTCFNDWCSINIYQKIEETDQHKIVLQKMKSPKEKIPHFRGLTNPAHSHLFYSSAYSGYKGREKELNENYDFRIALEWYLEANIASVLESKYLMACTCLELLVDRYQAKSGTEFTMNQDVFEKQFVPMLHNYSRDYMINLGLEASQRSEIYMKLNGLNRRSIGAGIVSLLEHLGIKYNDLIGDVNTIIKIRNEITHVGNYKNVDELAKAFNGLYVLLSRIFLKLVNYTDEYFDWIKGDWVHFKDVTI